MDKQEINVMSGKHEVELTDNLIQKIVKDKKWGDEKSLKQMRDLGAKWNTKRNRVVFTFTFYPLPS